MITLLLCCLSAWAAPAWSDTVTVQEVDPLDGLTLTDGRTVMLYASAQRSVAPGTYPMTWSEGHGLQMEVEGVKLPVTVDKQHPIDILEVACIDKDSSTAGMIRCTSEATRLYDVELNRVYKHLMGSAGPAYKEQIKQAQIAWIPFRDGETAILRAQYGAMDGTMYRVIAVAAIGDLTRTRTRRLWELAAPPAM